MNILDICFIVVFLIGGILGWRKGLIMELFTFGSLLAGVYCAFHFSDTVTHYFNAHKNEGALVPFLAFLFIFIIVVISVRLIGKFFEKLIAFVWLSVFNKILGSFVGLLKWGFLIGCILLLLRPLDPKNEFVTAQDKKTSVLYPYIMEYTTTIVPNIKNTILFGYGEFKKEIE
tara:strand:- start:13953 stop:14471 length:519 start_codon:yes stop_codon:yes gene_type:complete